MLISELTAISPVDGRYRKKVEKLDEYFSDEKHHIDTLKAKQEEIESLMQEITEEHEDDFNG